jgi:hypothetical protein
VGEAEFLQRGEIVNAKAAGYSISLEASELHRKIAYFFVYG